VSNSKFLVNRGICAVQSKNNFSLLMCQIQYFNKKGRMSNEPAESVEQIYHKYSISVLNLFLQSEA
jgi:hypothetical protein